MNATTIPSIHEMRCALDRAVRGPDSGTHLPREEQRERAIVAIRYLLAGYGVSVDHPAFDDQQ